MPVSQRETMLIARRFEAEENPGIGGDIAARQAERATVPYVSQSDRLEIFRDATLQRTTPNQEHPKSVVVKTPSQ